MATRLFDDDGLYIGPEHYEEFDPSCPGCGADLHWESCDACEDGYNGHDCGEDTCCCLHPDENVECGQCEGHGGWWRCWETHTEEQGARRCWLPNELPKEA